ncbi:MAG: hypothetical protein JJ850_09945 [Kordiimonadaceae bacterium]|nr:hypothetical protein [Kordiimonadaceae bacterium]MBO6569454.1 hypothetical protein [Kordiimonadaceae bacterium]MBO6964929.1 hypothetical protein [Kordiimonadaceae bacterium]
MPAIALQGKQHELLKAVETSVSDWAHPKHPFLQLVPMRSYELAYVVQNYYRPCGFVWKQELDKDLRSKRAAELRNFDVQGCNFHHRVAFYGLMYRLAFFTPDDLEAIRVIRLPKSWSGSGADASEIARRRATSFDIMMLQHVVRGWQNLAANAECLLQARWPDGQLKSLAADMAVQAHYEHVRPKIFRNVIETPDIQPIKAAVALAEKSLGPVNKAKQHYLALVAAMEGDLNHAVQLHGTSPVSGYRTQFFRTAAQVETIEAFQKQSFSRKLWHHQPVWDVRNSSQTSCSLIACDQAYFFQFFEGFAASFAIQNPGGLLHFHGVGFKPSWAAIEARIAGLDIEVNVSHDEADLNSMLPDRFKGYCAGARYMYLPFFLEQYEQIIVHDVDGVLTTSMESIWAKNDADVMISSLMLGPKRRAFFALWSNIGAGAFAIRNSNGAIEFADALSRYLAEHFNASDNDQRRYFFSDQTGLLLATLAYRDKISIEHMPQIFKQSTQHNGPGRGIAKKQAQDAALKGLR